MKLAGLILQEPFDLTPSGPCSHSRFHQLPINSVLIQLNGVPVSSMEQARKRISGISSFSCRFKLPNTPPALPDFVVVTCNDYVQRGGPNILGFPGAENLVPIPCSKAAREKPLTRAANEKDRNVKGHRVGFKVECAIVKTAFKGQGETLERNIIEIKDQAAVPGIFNVSVSRCKHGKHNYIPDGEWPNCLDVQSQRLNPFVIEAEIFERAIQIKASETLRKWSAQENIQYGETWTPGECNIADCIALAFKGGITRSVNAIHTWICKQCKESFDIKLMETVIHKMDSTHEILLKEHPPHVNEEEYNTLKTYQKRRGKK